MLEALLHYTTYGGAEVALPCVSLLDRAADGRVSSLRVHIDLAPLLERIGAEAAPQDGRSPTTAAHRISTESVAARRRARLGGLLHEYQQLA